MTLDPNQLSTPQLHQYLLGAVAPRPIAFASTIDKQGRVNLSPFSFFNVFSSNPPIMIFSPARGRDGGTKHSFDNVKEIPEVTINIVNYPMVQQMSLASSLYPKGVNEFDKAGFTAKPSVRVKPPRVAESPAAFECTVDQIIELGDHGGAGNLIICKVVLIHLHDSYLDSAGHLDTTKLDLVGRMGANWYVRAQSESLFEIPKPLTTLGIGMDQLPNIIKSNPRLTGNQLACLASVPSLPSPSELEQVHNLPVVHELIAEKPGQALVYERLFQLGLEYLEAGDHFNALAFLMLAEAKFSQSSES